VATAGSVILSIALKIGLPALPFMNRVGLVFLLALAAAVLVSLVAPQKKEVNVVSLEGVSYKTTTSFNVAGLGVILILVALYATWW
jgi:SSS family solute:Na+ symporter